MLKMRLVLGDHGEHTERLVRNILHVFVTLNSYGILCDSVKALNKMLSAFSSMLALLCCMIIDVVRVLIWAASLPNVF